MLKTVVKLMQVKLKRTKLKMYVAYSPLVSSFPLALVGSCERKFRQDVRPSGSGLGPIRCTCRVLQINPE